METEIDINAVIRANRFEAIEYVTHPCRKSTVIGRQLGPHFVFKWIFLDAWNHISANIATADRYHFHTTESLFNDAKAWAGYEKSTRIAIGRCLAYFVREGMLPLFCVNPQGSNKLYALINQ